MASVDIHEIGGNCPVQAEGCIHIDTGWHYFYYRARGATLSLAVNMESGDDETHPLDANKKWEYMQEYGVWPQAGWVEDDVSRTFIAWAAERFAIDMKNGGINADSVC